VSLKGRFLLYLALVHLVFLGAAFVFLRGHRVWLPLVEVFFAVSFLVGLRLARRMSEPAEVLKTGIELLESEDFMTRFREAHQPEIDRLIRLYNRMVDHLRDERVTNQEQDSLLRRLLEISPSGMITLDYDGRVQALNPGACRMLGIEADAALGRPLAEIGGAVAELGGLADGEDRLVTLHGRRRVRGRRLSFLDRGFTRSFLVLEELTKELHESEKAAWEKLIRTMSHEINNTSGAVISLLQSCLAYADQLASEDRGDYESGMEVAISRTRHMNAFMKAFADVVRLPEPARVQGSVEDTLRRTVRLMDPERERRRIRITWSLDPGFPAVSFDPAQMEQAFVNILRNAFEAIGEDGEVAITLGLNGPRPYAMIEDTGGGIPPEVAEKLFTSFYTSKPGGQGIGLTLVQEILLAHGFDYALETTGEGRTGFRIGFGG